MPMKTIIYGCLLYVFGVASAYFWNPPIFEAAIQQDGPVEYLTAFALLLMCVYIVFQVAFKGPISSKTPTFLGNFCPALQYWIWRRNFLGTAAFRSRKLRIF